MSIFNPEDLLNGVTAPKIEMEKEKERSLPILDFKEEIEELFEKNETLTIVGETGSGKSTQLPLIFLDKLKEGEKVLVSQPRRLPAIALAKYVAGKIGTEVGEKIGYEIRFDDHTNEGTKINFITDGILIREIQIDPLLKNYSVVMVDEAHERSLNIDFALGMLKMVQEKRQDEGLAPLKIVITSATIEKDKFTNFFDYSSAIEIPGRLYPIETHFEENALRDVEEGDDYGEYGYGGRSRRKENPMKKYVVRAKEIVIRDIIGSKRKGDVLIFMPGQEEIIMTIDEIEKSLENLGLKNSCEVLPCYGQMAPTDQEKILSPSSKRKVIVSTNIAETSLTIDGARYVIDTGLIKETRFDESTGITAISTVRHSQAGCQQRWGRSGRTTPGEVWCLYTKDDFEDRSRYQTPEILRSDLANIVLMMKNIGIDNVVDFAFVDMPKREAVEKALKDLKILGALDDSEGITELGKTMAEIPLEPKISRMIIEAEKFGCVNEVATIAAFLGGKNVFSKPKNKKIEAEKSHSHFIDKKSDFMTILNVFKAYEENHFDNHWARGNFLNHKVLEETKDIRLQLLRILSRNKIEANNEWNEENIEKSIASGLVGNLMNKHMTFKGSFYRKLDGSDDHSYYIHPGSSLFDSFGHEFITCLKLTTSSRNFAQNCQEVKPEWLGEIAPHMIDHDDGELEFDSDKQMVFLKRGLYLKKYGIKIATERITDIEKDLEYEATKKYLAMLDYISDTPLVHQENKKKVSNLRYYEREYGIRSKKSYDLTLFYLEKLGGQKCTSTEDFQKYSNALELDVDEFVDSDVVKKIEGEYKKIETKLQELWQKQNEINLRWGGKENPFSEANILSKLDNIRYRLNYKYFKNYEETEGEFKEIEGFQEAQLHALENPETLRKVKLLQEKYERFKRYFERIEKINENEERMRFLGMEPMNILAVKDVYHKLKKPRDSKNLDTLIAIFDLQLKKIELMLSNRAMVDSIKGKEKKIRKYNLEQKEELNPEQKRKELSQETKVIRKIIGIIESEFPKPDLRLSDKNKALFEIYDKIKKSIPELSRVQRELEEADNEGVKSVEGKIRNIFSGLKTILKRKMPMVTNNYNDEWIEDYMYLNSAIEKELQENTDAREFILEGIITKEELAENVRDEIDMSMKELMVNSMMDIEIDGVVNKVLEKI